MGLLRLSDSIYISTGHRIKGAPAEPEIYGDITVRYDDLHGIGPNNNRDFSELLDEFAKKRCGLQCVGIYINGRKIELYVCQSALRSALESAASHGGVYMGIAEILAKQSNEEVSLAFCDDGPTIENFDEVVISWGFNNKLINRIPAHIFIRLCAQGRFKDDFDAERYASALIRSVQNQPGRNPVKKCGELFSDPDGAASLLRVLADNKGRSDYEKKKKYRKWSQQTKSTCTTF